mmetsp:Transcript_56862/g.176375  ORF Transcript_56862/g.176375 Transcript_56862/m.176375 type:complete len:433 (+) Transcript_56862:667-1965(+)
MVGLVVLSSLHPRRLGLLALPGALVGVAGVHHDGDDGAERGADLGRPRTGHLKPEAEVLVALVQDDHHQGVRAGAAVGEGGHLERVPAGAADDPPRARADEPRKVGQVPESRLVEHPARGAVQDDGGNAEIPHVVGPALLVQAEVPVDPALAPGVDIRDDVHGVALPELPVSGLGAQLDASKLLAALGEEYVLVWPQLGHSADVLEAGLAADVLNGGLVLLRDVERDRGHVRPDLEAGVPVPVVRDTPDILGGLGVAVDDGGSLEHAIAVVVPNENLHRLQTGSIKGGSKMIADEDHLFLCGEEARLPGLQTLGLVLHTHPPDGDPGARHLLDEAHKVVSPHVPALLAKGSCVEALGRPHPRNGTPGAGEQIQGTACNLRRAKDHRNHCRPVVVDAEARQTLIVRSGLPTCPDPRAEVAGPYVHPAQRVAKS